MKRRSILACIFFCLGILTLTALIPMASAENLYESVIRIHVIANSDEVEEQADKLAVRDAILRYSETLSLPDTVEKAKVLLEERLDQMERIAEETLQERGKKHSVEVLLTKEAYPTRHYDTFSLPAGEYLSLQVKIGKAEGKNWWCVLFPPMCLQSAVAPEDALMNVGVEEENAKCITRDGKRYKIRFKLIELWGKAKGKIDNIF